MKELMTKRAQVAEEARALILKAEAERRALTSEEQTQYDARMADVKALGDTIERSRRSADLEVELDRSIGPRRGGDEPGLSRRHRSPGSDLAEAAMDTFLSKGRDGLTDEQRSIFGETAGYKDGIQLRSASPLSAVTGSAGADVIPQGFVYSLETAMKWYGGMRQSRARVLRTATGNTLPWPTMNDTGNVGEWVPENTGITQASTEMSFGQVSFGAHKSSSRLVLVPIELIQDGAFDVQAFVAEALGTRLGRLQNTAFTVGTGSGQPSGIVGGATLGTTGATGETTTVVYSDLNNMIHSVDPAYRAGAEWMMHDLSAAKIEQLVDNNGRPLLNDTLTGISGPVEAGSVQVRKTLLGYPVVVNNDVATMAANAKSILFGDMSKYVIRDVMELMLIRFGETYMASGQIGYVCFMRTDGNLVDAGMHPVKYFANSAS
jgi:HK97 family phage major capsid protein